ncbi:hypothetical protein I305_06317 [Cryptococcus gattii E566]|uniref:Uncharacterized protein n=2 Tax=Cryptococcus gattii TaxID=37769 RepID=E6R1H1_CRYGW|nr:Hypothetical Protein CGB_B9460C [Cryptococcus gattii WM276]ADV20675.1 Hypothetical Protein CGB_B9460C [Cryptococcus gattii WM276]KIR76831.1 hypothetical protein I306_06206 [Cryptococcus gattii EJB2]KIY31210.1 hypothetical protein I305_06317 [Cryptococcus gattii E566]KJE01444.1 hypothetical protein I311_04986 [Cryptococcus gattii NT-10]
MGKRRKGLTEKQQEAWPISLKIITELYECITLPLAAASPETPRCPPPSKDECHTKGEDEQREGGGGKAKSETTTTTTKISVSTSKEWDPASEETRSQQKFTDE